MKKKILLADDHEIVREGLRALIEKRTDMEIAGEANSGREAVRLVRKLTPDLIIMDISMPDLNGIDATRQVLAVSPKVRVVALSMHSDKRFVVGMLKSGARGYLLKESAFKELISAIEAVLADQIYLSPKIAGTVINDFVQSISERDISDSYLLTDGERAVLQLISEGWVTREIAAQLHISVKTVEARRKKMMEKLKLNNLAELIKFAVREGITSIDA